MTFSAAQQQQQESLSGSSNVIMSTLHFFASNTGASSLTTTTCLVSLLLLFLFAISFLWSQWNMTYHLLLWYEYYFTKPIPSIHVDLTITTNEPGKTTNNVKTTTTSTRICKSIIDPSKPDMIQCYNPSSFEWLGEVKVMNDIDIDIIIQKAVIAQKEWSLTSYEQRRRVLRTIQQYILQHMKEICIISSIDSGKSIIDAMLGEVITTTEKIRTIITYGEIWLQPERRNISPMLMHKEAYVEYIPYGIIATIAPWNYP